MVNAKGFTHTFGYLLGDLSVDNGKQSVAMVGKPALVSTNVRKSRPFNVAIMDTNSERLKTLKPVRSLDIYDGLTNNFHEDGLFSVSIFGRIGEEARDKRFSYIPIRTEILHPIIYDRLCRLKGLYKGILSGKEFANWDEQEKDFVKADELSGDTGYHFFMAHWRDIEFKETKSTVRNLRIKLVKKYIDRATVDKILVLPAGLRDVEIDASGRQTMDDINSIYWRIISISNTISSTSVGRNDRVLNVSRNSLQLAFNELYDMLENILKGKRGFIQNKWASRRVFNGTRNVISAMDTSAAELGSINHPKYTDTVMGIYQLSRGCLPLTIHLLRSGLLGDVFGSSDGNAKLVDPETLMPEFVKLPSDVHDKWTTSEGLESVIVSQSDVPLRNQPIMVEGRYLGLIYKGPGMDFRIFSDISELPADRDRKDVHPITLIELIYLSGYQRWNTLCTLVTRYPVIGAGSIYPSTVYVKTTITGEVRQELDESWQPMGPEFRAPEFPNGSDKYVDSLIPHPSRLAGLDADFDGDTASANIIYSDDALAEIRQYFTRKESFIDTKGSFRAAPATDTVSLVLRSLTED